MSDDPLLARLRAADPAAGTPPPPDRWIAELTEAVMSTRTHTDTDTEDDARPAPARRRTWLVPAAAAAVVAVVGVGALAVRPGDGPAPSAAPTTAPSVHSSRAPQVVSFTAGGGSVGRCLAVTGTTLRQMPTAFEGTVSSLAGRTALLQVTRWWRGTPAQEAATAVSVHATSAQLTELVGGVRLQVGQRYLVTATAVDQVTACGFSAAYSPRLERLYAEAFGG